MTDALFPRLSPEEVRRYAPLELAFVGDSVHTLLTRLHVATLGKRPQELQRETARQVNAASQAVTLQRLIPRLTAEEADIVRRGRNAHARHPAPRSAGQGEYHASTALEALYGYLFLTGQYARLQELDKIGREDDHHA